MNDDAMERAREIMREMHEACGVYHTSGVSRIAAAIREAEARADRILAALEQPNAELKAMAVAGLENMMSFENVADVVLRTAAEHLRKTI